MSKSCSRHRCSRFRRCDPQFFPRAARPFVERGPIGRERGPSRPFEVGFEIGTRDPEDEAAGLRGDLRRCVPRDDRAELRFRPFEVTLRDRRARQLEPRAERPGTGRTGRADVVPTERQQAEKLLRPPVGPALRPDSPEVRRGLARRVRREIELGEHDEVLAAEGAQRVRVLERHDRSTGLADLDAQLAEQVVHAPRGRPHLHHVLKRSRGALLVAALDRFRGKHEDPLLGRRRLVVRTEGRGEGGERPRSSAPFGGGITAPQERRVDLFVETVEECPVRGFVGGRR